MTDFDFTLFNAEVKKQFGEEAVRDLETEAKFGDPGTYIPTSSELLNRALGIGGVPTGRIIELFGLESSGKSTLALDICAHAQKLYPNRPVVYMDVENALNPEYVRNVGVDTSKKRFFISQEVETETVLDIAYKAAKSGAAIIVVDSIAGMSLKSDMESDSSTDARVGGNAKAIRAHLRNMNSVLRQTGAVALYLNQITYKMGVAYGNPETTPGGGGLRFFASQRLDIRQGEKLVDKSTGQILGIKSRINVVKNKVAAPYRKVEVDLIYGVGFDKRGDLIDASINAGILIKAGAWIKFGEEKFNGRTAMIEALKTNDKLETALRDTLHSSYAA